MNEYMNDEQDLGTRKPPIVLAPPRMTREAWERHQATHTPYLPSCKHCAAARATRRKHPKKRKHLVLVPDVDGQHMGLAKVSMDYMYLNERASGEGDSPGNPPHLVVVDHRHGRIWAHRVPNKGVGRMGTKESVTGFIQ